VGEVDSQRDLLNAIHSSRGMEHVNRSHERTFSLNIEHTRIFMREQYGETPIIDRYQAKLESDLANNPLVRFVQDLRNYMLHKSLPDSEMYIDFRSNPDLPPGGGELSTGIRIRAAPLLAWTRWSAPARAFIENSGEINFTPSICRNCGNSRKR
jgi:hypothetical protein